jgi:quercetin dioxygenase-like cupin family protein
MALEHARPGDVLDIRPLGARLRETRTHTLVKSSTLEVVRLVLPAGKQIPSHQVQGEVLVQCLEGKVSFQVTGAARELSAGQLVYLAGGDPHALLAIEDASLLVTILLAHK